MYAFNLIDHYHTLRDYGLVKSKRDFCRFIGRGISYLKDFECRPDRETKVVSLKTVQTLRSKLCALVPRLPAGMAAEMRAMIDAVDRDVLVADVLRR